MSSSAEDWTKVRRAFEHLSERDRDDHAAYLAREFGDRDDLRAQVEGMLEADQKLELDEFLEPPTMSRVDRSVLEHREGSRIASYSLRRLIAAGGMGAVYEADQEQPARRVALKMLRSELAGDDARRRFRDEVALLARLKHPGIAQIYEAGLALEKSGEGQVEVPWFAMELIEGGISVTSFAQREDLDLARRLALFRQVCEAVHHGHQRGVIHRDLKPANILIDASGHPKVIDFGVAKATDASAAHTRQGEIVGTLQYMSPEQIDGSPDDVDVRSDVYSLGVVLFELLTGEIPIDIRGLSITRAGEKLVLETPPAPSTLRSVPRELDWIVGRALAKEPERRYQSVLEFSEDLRRSLEHEPVSAGPPGGLYHVSKFIRRHRTAVSAAVIVVLALVGGVIAFYLGLIRAQDAEHQAKLDRKAAQKAETQARADRDRAIDKSEKAKEVVEFLVDVLSSPDPGRDGREVLVVDVLDRARESYRERFANRPDLQARLSRALGSVYHGLGIDREALETLEYALTLAREKSGQLSEELAPVLRELGVVKMENGDTPGADELFQEALELHESSGESDSVDAYRTRAHLGRLRLREKNPLDAEKLLVPALEGLREHLGEDHRDTLVTMNTLASVFHLVGKVNEATELYEVAIEGMTELAGADAPEVMTMRSNLSMLYHTLGRRDDAIATLRELLVIRREKLGPQHPETLGNLSNLGGLLQLAGKLDEAAPLYEEGLREMEKILPDTHPALQALRGNLSTLECERENFERSEELALQVYESRRDTLGEEHMNTLSILHELAKIARKAGKLELALERASNGFEVVQRVTEEGHTFRFEYERELGHIQLERDQFVESEEALLAALESFEAAGTTAPWLDPPYELLVALYEEWGKEIEATRYRDLLGSLEE